MPSGGKREGAGPPRKYLPRGIIVPPIVLRQLEEIAAAEGVSVLDVVREAVLSFIADWQEEHDRGAAG